MKILYTRVSSLDQNLERQKVSGTFDLIVEDKCSGAIPFFERQGGKEVLKYINNKVVFKLYVWELDRLARDVRDLLNVIYFFNQQSITIYFINQGLRTMDEDGKENAISKLIISVLGVVGEMERNLGKERQRDGIALAKLKKTKYLGRKSGSKENVLNFLAKPQNKKVLEYLGKGYKAKEAALLAGVHINTVTKIKKLGFNTV